MNINETITRVKQILTQPTLFFAGLANEQGIKTAFSYLVPLTIFNGVLGGVMQIVLHDYSNSLLTQFYPEIGALQSTPIQELGSQAWVWVIIGIAFGIIMSLIGSFIGAALLHAWIYIFGGRENYSKTYQLAVYASTPSLAFGWIPVVGAFAWIYNIVLLIMGTQHIHHIPRKKAILMYVIPVVLLGLMWLALASIFAFVLFGALSA